MKVLFIVKNTQRKIKLFVNEKQFAVLIQKN